MSGIIGTAIVITILVVTVFFCVRSVIRNLRAQIRGEGCGSCSNCAGCTGSCSAERLSGSDRNKDSAFRSVLFILRNKIPLSNSRHRNI
ncbi:MAG: FeoB-associated Cys-rich membrane protein [Lachnospiraceae bacterium]|nr:FeoB-associated Cys-rich membrane protein [Lachnospiraceae bacterium]